MRRLRPLLDRLGGPDAVTWPLFWVSFVSSALSHFAVPQPYVALPIRVIAVAAAQCAMFVPLLGIHWLLQREPSRSRPWLVITGYAAAATIRAVVLTQLLRTPDGSVSVPFTSRLTASFAQVFFVMIVTTITVSTSRSQARDVVRLLTIRTQLEQTREAIERQMSDENEAALARVQATLSEELASLEHASDDAERLQALHRLASDVVRPLSHELAQSVPTWSPPQETSSDSRVDWTRVLEHMSDRTPFRPVLTTLTVTVIMLVPSFIYLRVHTVPFLVGLVVSTLVSFTAANLLLGGRTGEVDRRAAIRWTLTAGVVASAVPALVVGVIVGGPTGLLLGLLGWVFLTGIAFLISIVTSVLSLQRLTARELVASNRQLQNSLVRLRQAQWFHQRSLARALHGTMQSAVVAAAFRLEAAQEQHAQTDELVSEVRADLARSIDVLSANAQPPMPLSQFTEDLTQVWSRVAKTTIEATEEARKVLDEDPILRAMVMEIASESISNAIRHGRASVIDVAISCPEDEVLLQVGSDGRADGGQRRSGLGSRLLEDCTAGWEESETPTGRVLLARFPTTATAPSAA